MTQYTSGLEFKRFLNLLEIDPLAIDDFVININGIVVENEDRTLLEDMIHSLNHQDQVTIVSGKIHMEHNARPLNMAFMFQRYLHQLETKSHIYQAAS